MHQNPVFKNLAKGHALEISFSFLKKKKYFLKPLKI